MVAQMIQSVDSPSGAGEVAIMAILTKTASLRADDAMTVEEAAALANMVSCQIFNKGSVGVDK
jgi:hypothetical protein